jgi:hypothetical protein
MRCVISTIVGAAEVEECRADEQQPAQTSLF